MEIDMLLCVLKREANCLLLPGLLGSLVCALLTSCSDKSPSDRLPDTGALAPETNQGANEGNKDRCSDRGRYGSTKETEIQKVNAVYVLPTGMETLQISVGQLSKQTTKEFIFETDYGSIPLQKFPAIYNTAIMQINMKGVSEGIHRARISAIYQDGSQSEGVLTRVRVGQSTKEVTKPLENPSEANDSSDSNEERSAVTASKPSANNSDQGSNLTSSCPEQY